MAGERGDLSQGQEIPVTFKDYLKQLLPTAPEATHVQETLRQIFESPTLPRDIQTVLDAMTLALQGALQNIPNLDLRDFFLNQILPLQTYVSRLRTLSGRRGFINPAFLQTIVEKWNRQFVLTVNQVIHDGNLALFRRPVLCAFSVIRDTVIYIDQQAFEALLKWAEEQHPNLESDVSMALQHDEAGALKVRERVSTRAEVLAILIHTIRNPGSGLKPAVEGDELQKELTQFVAQWDKREELKPKPILGGAAGNMSYVLSNLGFHVSVHWPYHSSELPTGDLPNVERVLFPDGQDRVELRPIAETQPQDPYRRTIACQIVPVPPWRALLPDGSTLEAKSIERVNFRYPIPELPEDQGAKPQRPWNKVKIVRTLNGRSEEISLQLDESGMGNLEGNKVKTDWGQYGWPHFYIFGDWQIDSTDGTWCFKIIGKETIRKHADEAKYGCAILAGITALGRPEKVKTKIDELLQQGFKDQVRGFRDSSIPLHTEITGVTSKESMKFLKEIMSLEGSGQDLRWSAGINTEELIDMTSKYDSPLFWCPKPDFNESLFARYLRAEHIAKQLELEWLYIHGNELDLILRKNSCEVRAETLRDAVLLAKAAVIAAMNARAEVPLADDSDQPPFSLAEKGFLALVEFASAYASWATAQGYATSVEEIRQSLAENGFYHFKESQQPDYTVVVAPVMWPELDKTVSVTGAGDYTSSVVAAYAWLAELTGFYVERTAQRGQEIYDRDLKAQLEKEHLGEIAAIDVESGKYFLGETVAEACQEARKVHPEKIFHLVRIGYPAVHTMRRLESGGDEGACQSER